MESHGVIFAALQDEVGAAFDPFDLVCHVAYDQKPLTRRERAENVRKRNYFAEYGDLARKVLDSLLDKYADAGPLDLENPASSRWTPSSASAPRPKLCAPLAASRPTTGPSTRSPLSSMRSPDDMSSISSIIKNVRNIMRQDRGVSGDAQRLEQLGWMVFLKILDEKDQELELIRDGYGPSFPRNSSGATGPRTPRGSLARN